MELTAVCGGPVHSISVFELTPKKIEEKKVEVDESSMSFVPRICTEANKTYPDFGVWLFGVCIDVVEGDRRRKQLVLYRSGRMADIDAAAVAAAATPAAAAAKQSA